MLHETASTREIDADLEMLRRKNKALDKYLGTLSGDPKYLLPDLMSDLRTNAWGKMRKNAMKNLKSPSNILSHAVPGFNPFKYEWDKAFHNSIFNNYKKDLMHTASKEGNSKLKKLKDTLKKNLITQDVEDRLGFAPFRKYDKLNQSDNIVFSDLKDAIGLQNLLKRGRNQSKGYIKMLKKQIRREIDGEHAEDLDSIFKSNDGFSKMPESELGKIIIPGIGRVIGGLFPSYKGPSHPYNSTYDIFDTDGFIDNK